MNPASFLAAFGYIANAPNGVERLRALVLQLAANGQLCPSNDADGNAEDLISKLAQEKEKFVANGSVRGNQSIPEVDLSNPLPDVPNHWRWIRLGNLTSKIGSGSTPRGGAKAYVSTGVPFLRSQNVWNDGIRLDEVVYIDSETHQRMRNTQVLPNDILLNITGASLGRCASVPSDFPTANVSQHVTIIRPLSRDIRHFIRICLLSPFGQQMIWGRQVGMAREGLSKKVLEQFEIPLPPLAEQKRIVAKVDELMALCDQLEAQQQERERLFPVLSSTCHARFAQTPSPANLNRIFGETGTVAPDDLRRTILTLAVKGDLVPQDPNDGFAVQELGTCGVDVERWAVKQDAKRHAVPNSWIWLKFAGVGEQRLGKMLDAQKNRGESKPYLRNTNVQWMRFELGDVKEMRVEGREEKELRLKDGDLLICEGGEPGRCAIWRNEIPEMYFQKALHRVRPCSSVLSEFLALNLQIDCQNDVLARYFTGATIKHFTGRSLSSYPIPLPPLAEQRRIVAKVDELMALVGHLEAQQQERDKLAEAFARACVAALTGTTQLERPEKMKAPSIELVSVVSLGKKRKPDAKAPLATLLSQHKGTLPAKFLWQQSGLTIDAFYQQLKMEIAQGWITPPAEAEMKVLEEA